MATFQIDKRSNLSHKEFVNEYVIPSKPVVITDAVKNWKNIEKFTPEFFKTKFGHIEKEVDGKVIKMGDYIDMMINSTVENPAPYPYNFNIEKVFPELMANFKPQVFYGVKDRVLHPLMPSSFLKGTEVHEFFFGGLGSSFPFLHIDAMFLHTQITQLYGDKEFFLFPPEQTPYMYPREDKPKISSVKNIFNPDFDQFPLFKNAQASSVMVNQGETVFFPTGWWHVTKMHGPCISYGRVHLNKNNWDNFIGDNYHLWKKYHPALAPFLKAYGTGLGKIMDAQEAI